MSANGPKGYAGRWSLGSLRLRILLAGVVWSALGIGGIWYSANSLFAKHIEASYHEELEVHIKELAGLVDVRPDGSLRLDRPLSDPRYLVPLSGFYWQITAEGHRPLRSPSMTRGSLDESVAHDSSVHHHVEAGPTGPTITYGLLRKAQDGADVHFVIATDERLLDETIASFTRELTLWLALLALALAATGLVAVSVGLAPLDRLAYATARLRAGKASRLEGEYPTEFAPLVADLNAFIDHNSKIVERARVEAGNLAHALRTPLAVLTDEAERLARDKATAGASEVLLEQSQAMVQQIEYQLARARSAVGARGMGAVSRIEEVLVPILSAMRRLHPERTFAADLSAGQDVALRIDPVDLSELLSILLDNAGKWARESICVELERKEAALRVRIVDDGPGVPAHLVPHAFGVGVRLDPAKHGSGLGLAIALDIAQAYDLQIALAARSDGKDGLEAVVTLPL